MLYQASPSYFLTEIYLYETDFKNTQMKSVFLILLDNKCTKYYGPKQDSLLSLATCENSKCKCSLGK